MVKLIKKKYYNKNRLRMVVSRSLKHIGVQIIDDIERKTLISVSTIDCAFKQKYGYLKPKQETAVLIGKEVAERAIEKNISKVCFDRNGWHYKGLIMTSLANSARASGLDF